MCQKKCPSTFILGNIAWFVGHFICTLFFSKPYLWHIFSVWCFGRLPEKVGIEMKLDQAAVKLGIFQAWKRELNCAKYWSLIFHWTVETTWNKRYSSENILFSFSWLLLFLLCNLILSGSSGKGSCRQCLQVTNCGLGATSVENKVKVVCLAEEFVKLSFYQLLIAREVVLVRGVTAFTGDLTKWQRQN